jgi:hypothetical protein
LSGPSRSRGYLQSQIGLNANGLKYSSPRSTQHQVGRMTNTISTPFSDLSVCSCDSGKVRMLLRALPFHKAEFQHSQPTTHCRYYHDPPSSMSSTHSWHRIICPIMTSQTPHTLSPSSAFPTSIPHISIYLLCNIHLDYVVVGLHKIRPKAAVSNRLKTS